ncbi:alpha/beta hydrolase fold domain-containing protein [Coraliomargarita sp. SDUM461004]|uniref:Alpha/beta hydrolase fold domain-containing protein n=1 Tax=Thalassobacterium sedimentorum TaxID=3041258 RepID=A0ABU1AFX0_9BACT|nr:alpha/beta hydrolase fold domain-containing protein [Coraliomargarita sp. SDUM461004]MDQ8193680.1 alpha/beta hydrolase fold domain-containing protein [Coraliomargarita sp. SDUM461004]
MRFQGVQVVLISVGIILGLLRSAVASVENFDWGGRVSGRDTLAVGDPISGIPLLDGVGCWQHLDKSQVPVLGGAAGIGNGRAVFPAASDGKVRNSGIQLPLEPLTGPFSVELTIRMKAPLQGGGGFDGFYYGLFDDSAEKNLLVNKERDRIWFRINPLGVATLHLTAGEEHYTQRAQVEFPVDETVQLKLSLTSRKLILERVEQHDSQKIIELNYRTRLRLNAMALNAIGLRSLELDSIAWSGAESRSTALRVGSDLHLSVPKFVQQSYTYQVLGHTSYQLEVFMPTLGALSELRPSILFLHGGSWKSGNRTAFYPQCRELAERGMIAISADYRTKGRDGVEPIEAVRDAKVAMRWIKSNAASLGIDPQRIAAGGGSAGGQLALSLALESEIDVPNPRAISTRPDALVLFNPVLNTGPDGFANHLVREYWEQFSPYHQLKTGLPPMLIMIGDRDNVSPPDMVQSFVSRARALGNEVEVEVYPGEKHGFFNPGFSPNGYDQTISKAKGFLNTRGFFSDFDS